MNKTIINTILMTLFGALVVTGCATTQTTDIVSDSNKDPSPSMTQSDPPVEPIMDKQPVKTAQPPITLEQIRFAYDQATLSEQARNTLTANATILQLDPELKVSIEGHCDDRGSDEYNLSLGERRAQSVRAYLVSLGIAPQRLKTISYGEEKPLDMANNEMAWAKNRRAEFKLLN
jgi:peptidoglycan-associated lipoprotein